MWDFIKFEIPYSLLDKALLHTIGCNINYNVQDNGESNRIYHKVSDNFKITQLPKSKRLFIEINFHKIHNSESHNGSDFNLSNFSFQINKLEELLGHNLKKCRISNFEYGVNLKLLNYSARAVLNSILLFRKKIPSSKFDGNFKEFVHADFIIKIYGKTEQIRKCMGIRLEYELLRVEIKSKKMRTFNTVGVIDVNSLLNIEVLDSMGILLKNDFKGIVYFDHPLAQMKLSRKEESLGSLVKWTEKIARREDSAKEKNTLAMAYKRRLGKLKSLRRECGVHVQDDICSMITQKVKKLRSK